MGTMMILYEIDDVVHWPTIDSAPCGRTVRCTNRAKGDTWLTACTGSRRSLDRHLRA